MRYLLGIDNGGTFSKAAIFSEVGTQVAISNMKTEVYMPKIGHKERNLYDLWQVNLDIIKDVIKKSNIKPEDISGISFSGHGKGLYLIGQDNRPLSNGILSTDTRAWKYVNRWRKDGTEEKVRSITYQSILCCQPPALLAYLKEYESEIFENIKYIFSVNDYIRYMMTGEAYSEYSNASGNNLINLKTKEYDSYLLELYGLKEIENKLPPLKKSYEICGYITKEVSSITGLKEGTPVIAGLFDIDACAIATGVLNEDRVCMVAGTWSINEYVSKSLVRNIKTTANTIFCMDPYYLIEESSATSAGNLEWFIRNIIDKDYQFEIKENGNIYDLVNNLVSSIGVDSNIYFLPYINGSSTNVKAKSCFIGLGLEHTKAHMLRAIYEGVVFSHMMHFEKLSMRQKQVKAIRLSGGVTNSKEWVQIFADIIQLPIELVKDKELGAMGAALVAGIGCGIYEDFKDAVKQCVSINEIIYPREEYKKIYSEKYEKYKYIVKTLDTVWDFIEE